MNKLNKFVIAYLKWASPLALIAAILSALGKSDNTFIYDILGWATIAWVFLLIYLVFALALQDQLKNRFVRWIAGIKEDDEREAFIAGIASKKTFIFMTGLIVLLIFLSVIRIDIYRHKTPNTDVKNHGEVRLGMGVEFIQSDNRDNLTNADDSDRDYLIHYKGFPLAVDGTLFLVGLMQIGTFYYFSRKENQI